MKNILIIGGGIAGMEAAKQLALLNYRVNLVEKKPELGGQIANWDKLFPNKRPAKEVITNLKEGVSHNNISALTNTDVISIEKEDKVFKVSLSNGKTINYDAILLTTGYDLFDAHRKEEYGYGIYNNVTTSAELEKMFAKGEIKTAEGKIPKKIGIVHCVGSRDEKCGNLYCSKVCCVTGVKQAIEIKTMLPETEVYNFYMDLRMFGRGFEQLYLEAQQKHRVRFVRGRLSEAAEKQDHSIFIKVDDTLIGRPMKMSVDLLVLMVGFEPNKTSKQLYKNLALRKNEDGFIDVKDVHIDENRTNIEGIFAAGTCTGAKSINETLADACSAVLEIHKSFTKH